MIENNMLHKSGAKSMLCYVVMKGYPLSLHIFIRTCLFYFAVRWYPSATSICLSVSSNVPGIKSETSGVIWHVAPESKIQLVNCGMLPKFPLGNLLLLDKRAIDAYIFWSLLFSPFLHAWLPFSFKCTWFCRLSFSFGGFGHFSIRWYWDRHIKHFRGVRSVHLLSESPAARTFSFSCLILLKKNSVEWLVPPQKVHFLWTLFSISLFLPKPELLSRFK